MKRTVQYFTKKYLENSKLFTPMQILQYLEDYKNILIFSQTRKEKRIPISIRLPQSILNQLKREAKFKNIPYQTLMLELLRKHFVT